MPKVTSHLVVAVVAFVAGGAAAYYSLYQPDSHSEQVSRPYYESLRLDSPESAVDEFVQAWEAADFLTVYLLLAAETQYTFYVNWNIGKTETVIPDMSTIRLEPHSWVPGSREHTITDGFCYFEVFVGLAKEADILPIRLEQPLAIQGSKMVEAEDERPMVDVNVMCKSHPAIVFRTIQSKSGRWRILYLELPNDDPPLTWPVPASAKWLPQSK